MFTIPVEAYLADALNLKDGEKAKIAFYRDWLPESIIDAHAHSNLSEHVEYITEKTYAHMLSTFTYYSIENSKYVHDLIFPGKTIRTLRFPKTFRGLNHRAANDYLLSESPPQDRIAIFGLPEDVEYTNAMLAHPRCSALKMYWSYVEPSAETIYDFFKPEILEVAQSLNIPIILHLPKMIVRSHADLMQMLKDFPLLRVSIAHLGLSKMNVPGLAEALDSLRPFERVSLDTALNPSPDVFKMAINAVGTSRIMFGSDEPLGLIRSIPYMHPTKGERLTAEFAYHWLARQEHEEFKHLAQYVLHAHWLSMDAAYAAIDQFPVREQREVKQQIFHDNARWFFGF